jgi:hypothetical protein
LDLEKEISLKKSFSLLFSPHKTNEDRLYKCPTNALVCIKTQIQMSHNKTFKITPTYFDHQMIIIRELSDPG